MKAAARPDFDPLSPEFLRDPVSWMPSITEDGRPVFYAPELDYFVVSRYADVEAVFRDTGSFSAAVAQAPLRPLVPEAAQILLDGGHKPQPSMVSLDPPDHERLRGPAVRAFTPRRVAEMEPVVVARTAELLDGVEGMDRWDLVADLSFPLPAMTIFTLIGVPRSDWAQVKEWCGSRVVLAWGRPRPDEQVEIARAMVANHRYLRELLADRQQHPEDDLASALVAIHEEDPGALTLAEAESILFSLIFAGHETSNNLIGNCAHRLMKDPARWQQLVVDPSLIPAAVDEVLRYDPSVPVWRRVATRDVVIGGVEIPAGSKLFLWLAAAGRDPEQFPDPERFDLHRENASRHLAFGKGIHYCLGANLAKLEARVALEALTARFPDLQLEPQTVRFHPNISFRGPQELWVRCAG